MPEPTRLTADLDWQSFCLLILQCERSVRSMLTECARAHDLSTAAAILLLAGREPGHQGLSQRELAERLASSPATISVQIEALRRRGFAVPHRCHEDRRKQVWSLTPSGAQLAEKLDQAFRSASPASDVVIGRLWSLLKQGQEAPDPAADRHSSAAQLPYIPDAEAA
jgi:DNA-binding MarR family transcriptional regulator